MTNEKLKCELCNGEITTDDQPNCLVLFDADDAPEDGGIVQCQNCREGYQGIDPDTFEEFVANHYGKKLVQ